MLPLPVGTIVGFTKFEKMVPHTDPMFGSRSNGHMLFLGTARRRRDLYSKTYALHCADATNHQVHGKTHAFHWGDTEAERFVQ